MTTSSVRLRSPSRLSIAAGELRRRILWFLGHLLRPQRYPARMGPKTVVHPGVRFVNGRRISLGSSSVIRSGSVLDGSGQTISIGDNVTIDHDATILTLGLDPQRHVAPQRGGSVTIGSRVWIASRAIVFPGVDVGEGAVIGQGAIVTDDVPAFTIVSGSPARAVGGRSTDFTLSFAYGQCAQVITRR